MIDEPLEVPISRLCFKNFKAFREAVVDLAPITVITGVNSSGKTTILQGLLLARNTLATRNISQIRTPLIFDQKPLKFTEFEEMVFGLSYSGKNGGDDNWREIALGYDWKFRIWSESIRNYFDTPEETWFPLKIGFETHFGRQSREQQVSIRSVNLYATPMIGFQTDDTLSLLFEPESNGLWKITYQFRQRRIQTEQFVEFDHFLPNLESFHRPMRNVGGGEDTIYNAYKIIFGMALMEFRNFLTQELHYVGPLRSAPEPSVIQQQIEGLDVGEAGEKTIQLLFESLEDKPKVKFVRLPKVLGDFNLTDLSVSDIDLQTALSDALRLMGIEQRLRITKQGISYQAKVSLHKQRRIYVPLTDAGFGISQVLPIVAVCLLSKPGDMVLLEQPEIHLHPRAQAGLADLLLCTALSGKQVIVETHSDHLINRMRRRLAEYGQEDNSNDQSDLVRIVFVSPPKEKGEGARVDNALITREGNITNWPPGFLAESATEARAILRAQTAKKTGSGEK